MSTTPVLPRGGRVRTQSPPVRRSSLTRSQSLPPIDPDAERRHLRDGTHASPSFGDATSHAETTAGEDSEHEEGWAFATERAAAVLRRTIYCIVNDICDNLYIILIDTE